MLNFDILQIALHVVNVVLWGAIIFICVSVYRYFMKKQKENRIH